MPAGEEGPSGVTHACWAGQRVEPRPTPLSKNDLRYRSFDDNPNSTRPASERKGLQQTDD